MQRNDEFKEKKEETWIASKFVDNHNHELHLTPRSTSLLLGHRVISRVKKNIKDILNELDVPTRKIMSMLSKEFDGDYKVGYVVVDIQNYLGNKRRKLLQDGDAHKVFKLGPFIELKRERFKVFEVEPRSNRDRTVMTS